MIVFHDPAHRRHDPVQQHLFGGQLLPPAEVAARADLILEGLTDAGGFHIRQPAPIEREVLSAVHTSRYLEFLKTAHARWRIQTGGGPADEAIPYIRPLPSTPWKEPQSVLAQMGRFSNDVDPILMGTWEAALAAASCAVAAADVVAMGERVAYALSRPPGHHAGPETYGGYCFLNNAALAAARLALPGNRGAILDIDTHHGNGTQTVFWHRPDVLTVSIHGHPDENYPFFLGYADETGGKDAEGSNANLPLPTGSGWGVYEEALRQALELVEAHRAAWLVVALGVDTHVAHRVLALQGEDYSRIGQQVAKLELPTVFVQEGGYEPEPLAQAVPAVLMGFMNA